MDQDEMYARRLAQQDQYPANDQRARQPGLPPRRAPEDEYYRDEPERSFFDDDLPEIGKNVKKGFIETQSKFNKWISDFRKRIDGDEDDPYDGPTRQDEPPREERRNFGPSQSEQLYGIRRSMDRSRRSGDIERYDADPHELGDDFTALEMKDEEGTYCYITTSSQMLTKNQ